MKFIKVVKATIIVVGCTVVVAAYEFVAFVENVVTGEVMNVEDVLEKADKVVNPKKVVAVMGAAGLLMIAAGRMPDTKIKAAFGAAVLMCCCWAIRIGCND